jgi:hypothetical protein
MSYANIIHFGDPPFVETPHKCAEKQRCVGWEAAIIVLRSVEVW